MGNDKREFKKGDVLVRNEDGFCTTGGKEYECLGVSENKLDVNCPIIIDDRGQEKIILPNLFTLKPAPESQSLQPDLMTLSDALIEAKRVGATKIEDGDGVVYEMIKDILMTLQGMPVRFGALESFTANKWSVVREPMEITKYLYEDGSMSTYANPGYVRKIKFREVLGDEAEL